MTATEPSEDDAKRQAQRLLLDATVERRKMATMIADYWHRAVAGTLEAELKRLGLPDDQVAAAVQRALRGRLYAETLRIKTNRVAEIERVTRGKLVRALTEGLEKNENVGQLASRVHEVLGGNRGRALTIARTESGQAVGMARFAAASAAGATGKYWRTGANPRGTHIAAGNRYARAGAIPMAEPFEVGSSRLLFPRDPSGEPGEIINCNCLLVTVRLRPDGTAVLVNASTGTAPGETHECA